MTSVTTYNLIEACREPGCPVCRIGARSVKRHLESLFYEYVNDPGTRDGLVNSLGFCQEHVRLLLETRLADGFGASVIYEHIVKVILQDFSNQSHLKKLLSVSSRPKGRARAISKYISASSGLGPCVACRQRDVTFDHTLSEMKESLGEEKLRLALQESDGLCISHLAQLLERVLEMDDVRFLLDLTGNKLKARQSEMAEFIRKQDYRFKSENITQEEAAAWRKTMCMISGVSISLTGEKHK